LGADGFTYRSSARVDLYFAGVHAARAGFLKGGRMLQDYYVTRRQFVGASAAALAATAVPAALSPRLPTPYRAIFDERYEAARRFAADALRRCWVTRAIRGDVTHVWFHELSLRWKRGPAPVAGLTTAGSLFVLERLSWDVGMRVTVRQTDATTDLVQWLISLPASRGHEA
jgi:hypothetical protein